MCVPCRHPSGALIKYGEILVLSEWTYPDWAMKQPISVRRGPRVGLLGGRSGQSTFRAFERGRPSPGIILTEERSYYTLKR